MACPTKTTLIRWAILVFAIHLHWAQLGCCPESTSRRGLFEQSEFPSHLIRGGGPVPHSSAHTQKMVLVTFAETKVTRRMGTTPRKIILSSRIDLEYFVTG